MNTLKNIGRLLPDIIGKHTKRKIIVFESDDWGAVRMPNQNVLKSIPNKYKKNFSSPYYKYDSIASSKDLNLLFEVLNSFKDFRGNPAILTANTIVTNPDFYKIEETDFKEYHHELFTSTIKKYNDSNIFSLWNEGISSNVFRPQLHGREHINVSSWLSKLQSKNEIYLEAFKRGIYSVDHDLLSRKKNLTAALDSSDELDSKEKASSVREACDIFHDVFGYKSLSFIAPSYTWDERVEHSLIEKGVELIQGIRVQKVPVYSTSGYQYKKHFLGQKNKYGQHYLVRNAFFEPSLFKTVDVVNDTLDRIYWSFKFLRPAIISVHRLNFIGRLSEKNRDESLIMFKSLLKSILRKWPDVEFLSTDELLPLYKNNMNNNES